MLTAKLKKEVKAAMPEMVRRLQKDGTLVIKGRFADLTRKETYMIALRVMLAAKADDQKFGTYDNGAYSLVMDAFGYYYAIQGAAHGATYITYVGKED